MRRTTPLLGCALAAALGCLGLSPATARADDPDDIQGNWDLAGRAVLRRPNAVNQFDPLPLTLRVTFTGGKIEIRGTGKTGAADMKRVFGTDLVRGDCSLNPTTAPKGIIIVRGLGGGQPVIQQGVYRLNDGSLTLKLALPGNLVPQQFTDQKDAEYLLVSGRQAGAAAPPGKAQAGGAPPAPPPLPDPRDPLVGKWAWFNGTQVTVREDGTLVNNQGNVATWNRKDPDGRVYVLRWSQGGFVDTVTLSEDGRGLSGTNQTGAAVSARRASGAPAGSGPPRDGSVAGFAPGGSLPITALALAPDGRTVALGLGKDVVLYEAATGKKLATWQGHQQGVQDVAFSPDGKLVASGGGQDGTVIVWDVGSGKPRWSVRLPTKAVVSGVAFSPDGAALAAGYGDGTVRLWDAARGGALAVLQGQVYAVNQVAFAADGKTVAAAGTYGRVTLWALPGGRLLATLQGPLQTRGGASQPLQLSSVTLSPGGQAMATGCSVPPPGAPQNEIGEQSVFLWDLPPRQPRAVLRGHASNGRALDFSPDGKLLALASDDGAGAAVRYEVKLWDVAGARERAVLARHRGTVRFVRFSRDGKTLVTSDGNEVKLWAVAGGPGPKAAPQPGAAGPAPPADPAAFSAGGRALGR